MRSILLASFSLALAACGTDAPPPEPPPSDAIRAAGFLSTSTAPDALGCDDAELVCDPEVEPAPPQPDPVAEPVQDVPPSLGASASCDPNYAGCVPIDDVDVDCAGGSGNGPSYAAGPVRVVGRDVYGLDRDGDRVGCDR
jgi:hypothetical protein